jgi:hypothetical protein
MKRRKPALVLIRFSSALVHPFTSTHFCQTERVEQNLIGNCCYYSIHLRNSCPGMGVFSRVRTKTYLEAKRCSYPLHKKGVTCYNASREDGPIAQRLELPAHKNNCAHALFRIKPTGVGGTEVKVSKAGSYPERKLKRGQ